MKNKLIILCLLLFNQLSAQQLSPKVWANAGQYKEISGMSINYTIGEALIQTATTGSNIFTFGFNQLETILSAIIDIDGKNIDIKAYPNPVIDNIIIELSEALSKTLMFTLSDINGKKVYSQKPELGTTHIQIPTRDLPMGIYFVEIRQEGGLLLHTFKIVKSK